MGTDTWDQVVWNLVFFPAGSPAAYPAGRVAAACGIDDHFLRFQDILQRCADYDILPALWSHQALQVIAYSHCANRKLHRCIRSFHIQRDEPGLHIT